MWNLRKSVPPCNTSNDELKRSMNPVHDSIRVFKSLMGRSVAVSKEVFWISSCQTIYFLPYHTAHGFLCRVKMRTSSSIWNAALFNEKYVMYEIRAANINVCISGGISWYFVVRVSKLFQQSVRKGYRGHMMSIVTTKSCWDSTKTAIGNMQMKEHGHIPIKHYLKKQALGQIWLMGHSLPTPAFIGMLLNACPWTNRPWNRGLGRYCIVRRKKRKGVLHQTVYFPEH